MARSKKSSIFIILSLIFSSSLAFLDASSDTLKQGDVLNNSNFLVSSNKIFTLGFFRSGSGDLRNSYLGIWYTSSPDAPVWVANRNSPMYNNYVVLTIDKGGKLIFIDFFGYSTQLCPSQANANTSTSTSTSINNITATLLDSGNFVVVREANSNGSTQQQQQILWQSFDCPTDTLLPGMKLGVNHRTGRNWSLTSWLARDEPASGAFTLEWDPRGRRLVVRRRGVIYWTSGVLKDDKTFEFMPKPDAGNFNYNFTDDQEEEAYFTYSHIADPVLTPEDRRLLSGWRIYYQGQIYDNQGRTKVAGVDLCYGYNTNGGCELWELPKCRINRHLKFYLRPGYFTIGGYQISPFVDYNVGPSISDCRDKCWNDCDCFGFTSFQFGCEFWMGNLTFQPDYSASPTTPTQYVLTSEPLVREKNWIIWIIWIVTAVIVALLVSRFGLLSLIRRRKAKLQAGNDEKRDDKVLLELMTPNGYMNIDELEHGVNKAHDFEVFSFACIMDATSSFSSECKLGEGGFGPVYKGKLPEGREIAVKRLSRSSGQGLVEFKNELILIAKLQHMNLVRLLGCCIQGDEKMLVYEYMPNNSLDSFLFDTTKKAQLTWERRLNIIEGIAQGIIYLHKYSRLRIIHRDLKASNILLDKNMNPKISDFGMAKIYRHSVSEANTNRVVGTYGYMAPEYAMEGIFSVKSDVFSFGVLMLEIVSGRKNNSFYHIEGPLNLVGFAWELWNKDVALELVDPTLRSSCIEQQLLRCIHVGLLCVEDRAIDRPTMPEVVSMLTNDSLTLPMPKKPAFLTGTRAVEEDLHRSMPEKYSVNGLSISAIDAR